jgi:hypothetical protein
MHRMYDQQLSGVWAVGCGLLGLVLLFAGARAAGAALVGAVVGAVVGVQVTSTFDLLPTSTVVGSTAGAVLFGLIGLTWRPRLSASALKALGVATLLIAGAVILSFGVAAEVHCHHHGWRLEGAPCVYLWATPPVVAMLALNTLFVAFMFIAQVPRAAAASGNAPQDASA